MDPEGQMRPKPLNKPGFRIHLRRLFDDIFPQGVHQNAICLEPGITRSTQNRPDSGAHTPKPLNRPWFQDTPDNEQAGWTDPDPDPGHLAQDRMHCRAVGQGKALRGRVLALKRMGGVRGGGG